MGKTIVLISSKGGSGKSTVAVCLATAFSVGSKSVLLIDADEGARCLDTMLSVNESTVFDIADVLAGKCEPQDAMLEVKNLTNVKIIPSPIANQPLDLTALGRLTEGLKEQFDYIIVDLKGQLPSERLKGMPKSAEFLSVVTPDGIAVRNTGILNSELFEYGIKPRLIINRFKTKGPNGEINNIDGIINSASARLVGIIPEDKKISSTNGPKYLGLAAAAGFRIASRLDGRTQPLPKIKNIIN